jgi:hypothetical protein
MKAPVAAALVLVVLALASCGSSGAKLYTLANTKACLVKKHVQIGGRLDFVATTATGGAFKAHFGSNFVTVVFGATQADANNIYQAYVNFHARNVGINDVLRQQQNAVMLWHAHPPDRDAATLTACLK